MRKRPGFSILELLTVISVMVVLIGLLIPVLAKVRLYARSLINIRNQRDIVTSVTLFACDHDQQFPASVALCERPDGSWRWQDPRKMRTTRPRQKMKHSSVAGYLADYMAEPDHMDCPNIPYANDHWQAVWAAGDTWDHPSTSSPEDPFFGSYCLYWNYIGYMEDSPDPFRGPRNLYGGPDQSELLVSDYLGFNGYRNRGQYGSCEPSSGAEIVDPNSVYSAYWSYSVKTSAIEILASLNLRLNAGYTDGHVERYNPGETQVMQVSETMNGTQPYWQGDPRHPGQFMIPNKAMKHQTP